MKKFLSQSAIFLVIASSIAAPAISADQTIHMSGYIVDHMCAPSAKEKKEPLDFLKGHSRECSVMPGCSHDGYDFYSSGKWYRFDNNGTKLARQVLGASKVEAGNYVTVDGTVKQVTAYGAKGLEKQDTIFVTQLKETKAPGK